ncbi:putative MFS transporter, AGZA family, xanthine/uracil permease [Corynebacterium appendicis CIP 107643]|uniref:Putative MFS transporter, AGZA family, xanthine/uracil permease n=1 Tax=Corynebacterium appendicis CIP 107643 TaxID=1161099 RepID=A0A1N7JYT6_9CORY|nr:Guanine/hypoxanthine permease PbuG [Corynebacterium appendicis CIP 107643]SIS54416.1 putative MFS transporter, AGZA family, xanthine/uracil permease [Corynebacterium appendicis CIP 107643]
MSDTTNPSGSTKVAETTKEAGETSGLDRFFHITERGSSVGREVRAGVVTFFAMAYIVLLNPLILGTSEDSAGTVLGIPQVAAATALVAGVMCILFGAVANYPFGIAAGLGLNTLVAVTLVGSEGLTWAQAMGLVVVDGIIIVLLAISGFRTAVFRAIPPSMKAAIGVGIGMFISLIGFVDAGFVRRIPDAAMTTVPVQLGINGSIASWPTFVFVLGLFICGFMVARQIPGGLFIGIVINTIIALVVEAVTGAGSSADNGPTGWNLAVPSLPDSFGGIPDLSIVGAVDIVGAFTNIGVVTASLLVFTLVLANFFDAMGTMTALGRQAGLTDEKGELPDMKKALVVEGFGAIVGGAGSASSATVYVDSSAGIADGARTGLANIVTGLLFLAAMFFTPLYEIVPIEAAAPVLVIVGALMMMQVTEIDWTQFHIALPSFLTIVAMPFTYSIADGIGIGFITFALFSVFAGKAKDVHWLMWLISALFVVFFAMDPIMSAVS